MATKIEQWIIDRSGGAENAKSRLMLYHDLMLSDGWENFSEQDRQDRAAMILNIIHEWDTQKALAEFLGVDPKKLQRWVKQNWFKRIEPEIVERRRRDFTALGMIAREKLRNQLEKESGRELNQAIKIALDEARREEAVSEKQPDDTEQDWWAAGEP